MAEPNSSPTNLASRRITLSLNKNAWDHRAETGDRYVDTATADELAQPLRFADPFGWLKGNVSDMRILCLAAGGGRHGPLFAKAGANVSVVDISESMLALDKGLAQKLNLKIECIQAPMDELPERLRQNNFDAVFHPVSTCYTPHVETVFQQVHETLKPGGLYLSFHKQPVALQTRMKQGALALETPYYSEDVLPPETPEALHRESGTQEFLHRWESLLGGICQAGFSIEDFVVPNHARDNQPVGSFGWRAQLAPPFFGVKARKTDFSERSTDRKRLLITA